MTEHWKPIPGYETLYEASNMGRIRSSDRIVTTKNGIRKFHAGRVLKPVYGDRDKKRASVFLCDNGIMKRYTVARLVAMTWCKGYQDGLSVDHIDGNTLNDCAENLEWVTISENIQRGYALGLMNHSNKTVLEDEYGNRFEFRSTSEACDFLGKVNQYINSMTTKGRTLHGKHGEIYKLIKE